MKLFTNLTKKELFIHFILYAIGIIFIPLGVVLTINAHLGAGGYDALNFALGKKLGINTSLAIYMTAFLAVILTAFIRKGFPKITTLISSFFLGLSTDFWKMILKHLEGNSSHGFIILLAAGMIIIAFAIASYVISIFPSNPTDDLVVALTEKKWRLGTAKIVLDLVCVAAAVLLQGEIGVGTVIITLGLGPIIDFFHYLLLNKILPDYIKNPGID